MRYAKHEYENTEFYEPDEDITNHQQKVVKTRKEHKCYTCQSVIKLGDGALLEKCFMDGKPQSAYTCLNCCDKWLNAIMGKKVKEGQ